jgi:ubiquinone/menaquinone biosynthesis C-methylase UbiE
MGNLTAADIPGLELGVLRSSAEVPVPKYLSDTYWWAYLHPNAVRLFERQWLVNVILWGNFARLRDLALDELGDPLKGRTLQVACVYGDFTPRLAQRLASGAKLEVVDVAPVQLENLARKLRGGNRVALLHQDSTRLEAPDAHYDQTVRFFLLHEQPAESRARTLAEALRVTKPGGKLVVVDYHNPVRFSPMRLIMQLILRRLEPFALDLWEHELSHWLPRDRPPSQVRKETYFGGLYQKLVMIR